MTEELASIIDLVTVSTGEEALMLACVKGSGTLTPPSKASILRLFPSHSLHSYLAKIKFLI